MGYHFAMDRSSYYKSLLNKEVSSRYKNLDLLAQGGMGAVFRAHDTRLERSVILKFPRFEALQKRTTLARFQREAYALAKLEHPNVLRLYDLDEHEEQPFIVTEDVSGISLDVVIEKVEMSHDQKLQLFIELAGGLKAVHNAGILHRDIKPENILVTPDRHPKLIDFGLSLTLHDDKFTRMTKTGQVVGTLSYLAPELLRLDNEASEESDIYSLGVVAYELFAQCHPYSTFKAFELLDITNEVSAKPVSSIVQNFDPDLDRIILAMIERKQNERPQSIDTILKQLSALKDRPLKNRDGQQKKAKESETLKISRYETTNSKDEGSSSNKGKLSKLLLPALALVVLLIICWKGTQGTKDKAISGAELARIENRLEQLRDELLECPPKDSGKSFHELAQALPKTRFIKELGVAPEGVSSHLLALYFLALSAEKRLDVSACKVWYELLIDSSANEKSAFRRKVQSKYFALATSREMLASMATFIAGSVKKWDEEKADELLMEFIKTLVPPRDTKVNRAHRTFVSTIQSNLGKAMRTLAKGDYRKSFEDLWFYYIEYLTYSADDLAEVLTTEMKIIDEMPLRYWRSRMIAGEALATLYAPPLKSLDEALSKLDEAAKGAPKECQCLITIRKAYTLLIIAAKKHRKKVNSKKQTKEALLLAKSVAQQTRNSPHHSEVLIFRLLTMSRTMFVDTAKSKDAERMANLLTLVDLKKLPKEKMYLFLYAKAEVYHNLRKYKTAKDTLEEALKIAPYRYKRGIMAIANFYEMNLGFVGVDGSR